MGSRYTERIQKAIGRSVAVARHDKRHLFPEQQLRTAAVLGISLEFKPSGVFCKNKYIITIRQQQLFFCSDCLVGYACIVNQRRRRQVHYLT
jgi:hypothetical protein